MDLALLVKHHELGIKVSDDYTKTQKLFCQRRKENKELWKLAPSHTLSKRLKGNPIYEHRHSDLNKQTNEMSFQIV